MYLSEHTHTPPRDSTYVFTQNPNLLFDLRKMATIIVAITSYNMTKGDRRSAGDGEERRTLKNESEADKERLKKTEHEREQAD